MNRETSEVFAREPSWVVSDESFSVVATSGRAVGLESAPPIEPVQQDAIVIIEAGYALDEAGTVGAGFAVRRARDAREVETMFGAFTAKGSSR